MDKRDEIIAMLAFLGVIGLVLYRNSGIASNAPTIAGRTLDQFTNGPAYLLANQPPFLFTPAIGLVLSETPPQHDPNVIPSPMIGA